MSTGRTAGAARSTARRAKLRYQVWRLRRLDSTLAHAAADALESHPRLDLTSHQADWIRRIEALRAELASSSTVIRGDETLGLEDSRYEVSTVGQATRQASKPAAQAQLLMSVVRRWAPRTGLELGTCVGLTAAYQGAAMAMNEVGDLVTLEGNPDRAALATENLSRLGLTNTTVIAGLFADTLPSVLQNLDALDYVFIDGHHEEQATLNYFGMIRPHLADQAVVLFDDIRWSEGMRRAWARLTTTPECEVSVNLRSMGMMLFNRSTVGCSHEL